MLAEKIIKKHVAIIHAYSLMSSLQRKIINVLLYEAILDKNRINNSDSVAIECRISFSGLSKAINFNSNNTQYLKEVIDDLASLKIEWNLLKDKVPTNISFLNLRVLHGPPTFYQDGTFNYSFHKVMLDLVDNPAIYGVVDLNLQSKFESKYGHALYENSTRFVNLQKNKIIQLDTFRKLLGVREDKYLSMRELTRNVIKPAVEEVNDRVDFIVDLEPIKVGRKVTGFELSVENKKNLKQSKNDVGINEKKEAYRNIKETFEAINDAVLESILLNYSEAYILEKIAYTRKHAKEESSGGYPIPYFISALKYDYKSNARLTTNVQSDTTNQNDQWKEKLLYLQADLEHWKKHLEYTNTSHNKSIVENAHKIIAECEEKLRHHILERPTCKNEVV